MDQDCVHFCKECANEVEVTDVTCGDCLKARGGGKYEPTILTKRDGTPIPAGEPWMAYRAQDRLSLPTLNFYRQLCVEAGCSSAHLMEIDERLSVMGQWQSENPDKVKLPD